MKASPRQRPIPVTSAERQLLDQQKEMYERFLSEHIPWGQFLVDMALLAETINFGLEVNGEHNKEH
jgi:hypothetical protein